MIELSIMFYTLLPIINKAKQLFIVKLNIIIIYFNFNLYWDLIASTSLLGFEFSKRIIKTMIFKDWHGKHELKIDKQIQS
jgi:hypothetical protein